MSGDASLRSILAQTDSSAQNIQRSAGAMMRLYDRSATTAVNEWRNTLQSCRTSQLLPLLYVANEVLQNSKRNRGTKFLEAFSPALSTSLQFIVERDPSIVEKVRRTLKILGDRRVFSVRYIGELLKGLESFRNLQRPTSSATNNRPSLTSSSYRSSQGSYKQPPVTSARRAQSSNPTPFATSNPRPQSESPDSSSDSEVDSNDSDESSFASLGGSPFANAPDDEDRLDVNLVINKKKIEAAATEDEKRNRAGIKRRIQESLQRNKKSSKLAANKRARRLSNESEGIGKRKPLSTTSLHELLSKLSQLHSQFASIAGIISSLKSSNVFQSDSIEDVTGDELIKLNTQVSNSLTSFMEQKRALYKVTQEIHAIETELKRYIPWLKVGFELDEEEIKFCEGLQQKINILEVVHADAKVERDARRKKEAKEMALREEALRKKAEEEELERSLAENMNKSKQSASAPGMVFNRTTREYQYVGDVTEESWRD